MSLLAHDIHGSGPEVLVLLHPIATHRAVWDAQVGPWSVNRRVIPIDLPGHGDSPLGTVQADVSDYARAVWTTLDTLGVTSASIAGVSFGGMVAQAMALQRSTNVSALILGHTTARTDERVRAIWDQRLADFDRDDADTHVGATLARWFTPGFRDAAPLTTAWVGSMIRRTSAEGYKTAVRAIQKLDHWDQIARLELPTLVVAGSQDVAIPLEVAGALAMRINGSRFKVLQQAAHLGIVEQATTFTEFAGAFLDQVLGSPRP